MLPLLPQMPVVEVPEKVDQFLYCAYLTPIGGNNVEPDWPPGRRPHLIWLSRCSLEDLL